MLVNDCADANDPLLLFSVDNSALTLQDWSSQSDALVSLALDRGRQLRRQLAAVDVAARAVAVQFKWQRKLEQPDEQALAGGGGGGGGGGDNASGSEFERRLRTRE
jgi:hypothetical protein